MMFMCGMDGRFDTECRVKCHCGVEQTNLNERQDVGMRAVATFCC